MALRDKSVHANAYNTRKTSEAILLSYSPNFPLEIKKDVNFYIPDYFIVCENLDKSLAKISQTSSIEKRIKQGINALWRDTDWNDWNDLMSHFYSPYSRKEIMDFVENRGELTFRFKDGVRETILRKFEDYWNPTEQSQWKQIWGLTRGFALEELRKRRPCSDCPRHKELAK